MHSLNTSDRRAVRLLLQNGGGRDDVGEEGLNDGMGFRKNVRRHVTTADLRPTTSNADDSDRFLRASAYVGIARIVGRLFGIRRPLFIAYRCQTPGTISDEA